MMRNSLARRERQKNTQLRPLAMSLAQSAARGAVTQSQGDRESLDAGS